MQIRAYRRKEGECVGINRTRIEWTNYSWNPIVGCDHGCWYCYAKKIAHRFPKKFPNGFKPTFHPERLHEISDLKTPSKIFVCSISDLFAPWTEDGWRDAVLQEIFLCPVKHTFQLLTKNPERIPDIEFPENVWVGTTVTGEGSDRINIEAIKKVRGNRFVSFEPLLGNIEFNESLTLEGIDWVIVGKLTGSRKMTMQYSWLMKIIAETERVGIPLFMKNNLFKVSRKSKRLVQVSIPKYAIFRQQYPEGMAR